MSFINYKKLEKQGLSDTDYHVLQKLSQRSNVFLDSEYDYSVLLNKNYIKEVKKGKTQVERLRIDSKGREFLAKIQIMEKNSGTIELCEELTDLFESHSVETGNKRKVLEVCENLYKTQQICCRAMCKKLQQLVDIC